VRTPLPSAALALALLSAATTSCAHAGDAMRTVELSELRPKSSSDMVAARAWRRPALLTFALDGEPTRQGDQVRLAGWLTNASDEPQLVILFPIGAHGFIVEPAPGTATRLPRPGPPMPPPAPLPPERFTMPAQSRVRFETGLMLLDYTWDAGKPRELWWSFQFWDEPKPQGRLPIP
jgi:hypothetical protein